MSLVRDDWLFSQEGIGLLEKAIGTDKVTHLWVDPSSNSLQLSYLDDDEDEEFLRAPNQGQP